MKRKLKLQVQMSIDGYIAGSNGEMDWMTWGWDEQLKNYVSQLTDSIDTIIMGRKLAEGFIPHWANIYNDPKNEEYPFAKIMTLTPKLVFSKSLDKSNWENTVIKNNLISDINELKAEEGKDIIVYGGAEFVSNLIKASLIEEFHLFINPVAVGNGLTIFHTLNKKQDLELLHSQAFDCGINVLTYGLTK